MIYVGSPPRIADWARRNRVVWIYSVFASSWEFKSLNQRSVRESCRNVDNQILRDGNVMLCKRRSAFFIVPPAGRPKIYPTPGSGFLKQPILCGPLNGSRRRLDYGGNGGELQIGIRHGPRIGLTQRRPKLPMGFR